MGISHADYTETEYTPHRVGPTMRHRRSVVTAARTCNTGGTPEISTESVTAACDSTTVSARTQSAHRHVAPSLREKYSHQTGIKTLADTIDHTQERTVAQMLHEDGYQTAIVGKWHLGHGGVSDPHGFDYWNVFPVQGAHINPEMIEMGERKQFNGYSADIVTDNSLNWLQNRETDQPFFLMTTYKATHDPFFPNPKHQHLYTEEIPEPPTFNDGYENRAGGLAAMNTAQVGIMHRKNHLPEPIPENLEGDALKRWNYQCYMQNYLRCAHAIDENVGRLLDHLGGGRSCG